MQLIVSNPRYGSTHITEHVHSKLRTHCRVHEFKGSKELLLDPPLWRRHAYERDIGKWSIEEKIKFIEDKIVATFAGQSGTVTEKRRGAGGSESRRLPPA